MSDELLRWILTGPVVIPDPYPLMRELRESSPVFQSASGNQWVLTRYDDCRNLLRDPRFGSPVVQLDGRTAFEAVDIAGHRIEKGQMLMTMLGAANRDPAAVDYPDRFDVGRDEVPLLSFGSGIHYCLGASLARLEGQVVLSQLLDRFPNWKLTETEPPSRNRLTLRGLERLPVALEGVS